MKPELRKNARTTEKLHRVPAGLDQLSALEIATLMNHEDAKVVTAVHRALPSIALAIDEITSRLAQGGRLIYVGSGTSGRIGALDASECPPTFGTDPAMIQYLIAGGEDSLATASESSEDSAELGTSDIAARKPRKKDVVVGLSASGRTPYTLAVLKYAKAHGAATIAVACTIGSELAKIAAIAIEVEVGPEVLSGSTRLKAGTAEKMICNMLTTAAMARLGHVYGNQMTHLQLKNQKLIERGLSIVQQVASVDRSVAFEALQSADMEVPVALVMLGVGVTKREAARRLKRARGNLRMAIGN